VGRLWPEIILKHKSNETKKSSDGIGVIEYLLGFKSFKIKAHFFI
jgi:hypothetical protein